MKSACLNQKQNCEEGAEGSHAEAQKEQTAHMQKKVQNDGNRKGCRRIACRWCCISQLTVSGAEEAHAALQIGCGSKRALLLCACAVFEKQKFA